MANRTIIEKRRTGRMRDSCVSDFAKTEKIIGKDASLLSPRRNLLWLW